MSALAAEASPHYLAAMPLPRPAAPRALWNDIRAFWSGRPRHQWAALGGAIAIPIGILFSFYLDSQTNILPGETITYVESWPATRTDEEIKAKQKADLEELRAWQAERQRQFQRLDSQLNRLGI